MYVADNLITAEWKAPLFHRECEPSCAVKLVQDNNAWQGWRTTDCAPASVWKNCKLGKGDFLILDFNELLVGSVCFKFRSESKWSYDAPLRIRLTFAETPRELLQQEESEGTISTSWLQDEIYTIDDLESEFIIERRFSFRYLRFEVLAFSECQLVLEKVLTTTVTSADDRNLIPAPAGLDAELAAIDHIGINTLKNCMQSVFEDGPKRDRRLWLGDLRLQMLLNTVTYRNFDLAEYCLRLLAAARDRDGFIPGCVFNRANEKRGCDVLDYALLFGPTLLDFLESSNREDTVLELFDAACCQLDCTRPFFKLLIEKKTTIEQAPRWIFIDHAKELNRQAAFIGTYIYSLKSHAVLAGRLGKNDLAEKLNNEAKYSAELAKKQYWMDENNTVVSGEQNQISYASLIWFSLSGIIDAKETAKAIRKIKITSGVIEPVSPYLWHYWVEMLFNSGFDEEAWRCIRDYWGGMVRRGADTFWEVYHPANPEYTPYKNIRLNSNCHAWSCTPSYFIRKIRIKNNN